MKHLRSVCAVIVVAVILLSCFLAGDVNGAWHYAINASGEIEIPISVEVFPLILTIYI